MRRCGCLDVHKKRCGRSVAAERFTGGVKRAIRLDDSRANAVERNPYRGPNRVGKWSGGAGEARHHTGMRTKAAKFMGVVGGGRDELLESTSSARG